MAAQTLTDYEAKYARILGEILSEIEDIRTAADGSDQQLTYAISFAETAGRLSDAAKNVLWKRHGVHWEEALV